jgi:hypothetical protein
MDMIKKLLPFWISILATPVFCLIALFSAGMGHGDYLLAMLLFPFTLLATVFVQHPAAPSFDYFLYGSALLQYPVYGIIFSFVNSKRLLAVVLVLMHVCLFAVNYYLAYKWNFL